jgi:hypothetical protein
MWLPDFIYAFVPCGFALPCSADVVRGDWNGAMDVVRYVWLVVVLWAVCWWLCCGLCAGGCAVGCVLVRSCLVMMMYWSQDWIKKPHGSLSSFTVAAWCERAFLS